MRRPIRILGGAGIVAAWLASMAGLAGPARAQFGPVSVYLEKAEKKMVRKSAELIGTTEARRTSTIGNEVPGRVEKMLVDAGDFVKAGQPILRMRALPTELQLRAAEGQLAAAQAMLAKMEAGFRREEVDQAEARVKAAKAGYDRWSQEYERINRLLADGASTKSEMEATEAAYRQAKEQLAEAEAGLALFKAGSRPEDVDSARAQVATASSAVAQLKDTLAKMTATMPFDGFIVRKMTEEGEWLAPGVPIVEVVDIGVVRVQLDVPERYLAGVQMGAKAPVAFEALGDREFAGQVSQIVPRSAEGTHTVPVRVDIPNAIENGRPVIVSGLMARVWLPVGTEHEALVVPKSAIIRQEGRDLVYTVSDKPPVAQPPAAVRQVGQQSPPGAAVPHTAAPPGESFGPKLPEMLYAVAVPVKIVQGYGRYVEVESDVLKVGAPVVTRGTYLMTPGKEVRVYPKEGG